MKLLILTQKVDLSDDVLGFFHRWIEEFSRHCEKVVVICLERGEFNLPENVSVLSLGKEHGRSILKYLINFYRFIFAFRNNYDYVFIHMNPEYAVLGGFFWKLMNKKIVLWYTHKRVDFKLRAAEKLVDKIFTASRESFRLLSGKVEISGHGVDTEIFSPGQNREWKRENGKLRIVGVGRIAQVKSYDVLIEAAAMLEKKEFKNFEIKIAGAPILEEDFAYFEGLRKKISEKNLAGKIFFAGPIPHKNIADFYRSGDIFVNLSDTGSIDKAVLEAMACGLKVLTSNEAFERILPDVNFTRKNPKEIAEKITALSGTAPNPLLREYVVQNHNLKKLVERIAQ